MDRKSHARHFSIVLIASEYFKWNYQESSAICRHGTYELYPVFHSGFAAVWLYMTLQNMFVLFDFKEPLVFFILDYLTVIGLFVWGGYYVAEWLKRIPAKR